MTQPTLDGHVPHAVTRLFRAYTDNGQIVHGAWLRAVAARQLVGTCSCGGHLKPLPPEQLGARVDYTARCTNPGCRHEIAAPGGRTNHHGPPARGG